MKRNKTQKPIFTAFNQRVTGSNLKIDSSITHKKQLHGDNLFNVYIGELKLLDDPNNLSPIHVDTEQKLNNKGDMIHGIRLSVNFHDYGKVLIDTFEEFHLIIFNEGERSLTLEEITGLPANGFALSNPPVLPATIPSKGSQFLRVLFSPEAEGEKTSIVSLTLDNHQRHTLQVRLTGTAFKAYFLLGEFLQGRGSGKTSDWGKLGWGEVCPCCTIGEVQRVTPLFWMRLIPLAGHFACRKCGARFLTIYRWGKVLFEGDDIRR